MFQYGHLLPFIAALVLAAVHLLSGRGSRTGVGGGFLSFAGGVALAYVFMHILPDIAEHQAQILALIERRRLPLFRVQLYFIAMAGLIFFYVLHAVALRHDETAGGREGAFRYDMTAACCVSFLVGYIFAHHTAAPLPVLLATVAFGAHFWTMDRPLLEQYGDLYREKGSIFLAVLLPASWVFGRLVSFPPFIAVAAFAFVAGGIIIYALRSELPEETSGDLTALCFGAALFSVLILAIDFMIK
jgi:nitrogen fixation-related uncharacterized protein